MFNFVKYLLQVIFKILFSKRKNLICTLLRLKKENEIYKRHLNLQKKRLQFKRNDKFTLAMLSALSKRVLNHLTLVKPKTLLDWQKRFIKVLNSSYY